MTTLSDWLRAAREGQRHPKTGKPWSQAYAAQRISEETGKTLYREALNGYENGKGMEPETYQRLVEFWAAHKVLDPPALNSKPLPQLSLEERAVVAAERQADAAEAQAILMAQLVAHLTGAEPVDPGARGRAAAFLASVAARQLQPELPAIRPATS